MTTTIADLREVRKRIAQEFHDMAWETWGREQLGDEALQAIADDDPARLRALVTKFDEDVAELRAVLTDALELLEGE